MNCVKALATLSQTHPTVLAKTKALQHSPGEYHLLGMIWMPKPYAVTCRAPKKEISRDNRQRSI